MHLGAYCKQSSSVLRWNSYNNIHSFNHIHTIDLSIAIRWGISPSPHRLKAQWEDPPCGAEPRIELEPALQQADALPTEPRRTITTRGHQFDKRIVRRILRILIRGSVPSTAIVYLQHPCLTRKSVPSKAMLITRQCALISKAALQSTSVSVSLLDMLSTQQCTLINYAQQAVMCPHQHCAYAPECPH